MTTTEWMDDAACRGVDPDLFHNRYQVGEAKEVCRGCPVRLACLEYALAAPELRGVLGGVTTKERVRLRRRLRLAVAH